MSARKPFNVQGKSPQELIAEIRGLEGTCSAQDAEAQKVNVQLGKLDVENRRLKKEKGDTVYVVMGGCYSGLYVDSVYRTKEEAETAARLTDDGEVHEMEFETIKVPPAPPPSPDPIWKIIFTLTGTILSAVKLGAYEKPPLESLWISKHPSYSNLIVYCRAKDVEHAQKIATDKRAEFLATEEGIS